MFTGFVLDAQTIRDNINHPCNALNLQANAHDSMDKYLAWGIEAISSGGQVIFFFFVLVVIVNSHIIVQLLLPNCSTGLGVTGYTAEGR